MESSRRDLLNDVAEHRPILKNNQNTYNSSFGITPKTGIALLETGFYCESPGGTQEVENANFIIHFAVKARDFNVEIFQKRPYGTDLVFLFWVYLWV